MVKFTLLHAVFMERERKRQRGNYVNEKRVLKAAISEQNFDIKYFVGGKKTSSEIRPS